jgi:hypothetical protein
MKRPCCGGRLYLTCACVKPKLSFSVENQNADVLFILPGLIY